ncbi:hypothetical protein V8E36_008111 [Tilletia maclaganii]
MMPSQASVSSSSSSYFQQQQQQYHHQQQSSSQVLSPPATAVSTSESVNDTIVKDLCTKRIQSIVYLKRTLEGRQSWLNTVRLSKRDLAAAFDTEKMKKRTIRNMYLGLSLAPLIELSSLNDLCKTIVNLFAELESWSEHVDKERSKVVRSLFRTTRGTKRVAASGTAEFMSAEAPNLITNEYTYLLTPNLPFAPDYFHTFFTLADMLQEIYYKIMLLLSSSSRPAPPSAFNPASASSASTVGSNSMPSSSSPVSKIGRGVGGSLSLSQSQLGSSTDSDMENDFGKLLGVANGISPNAGREPGITNGMLDLVNKVDGKLKKILVQTAKEVDALARHLMKEELTTLELQVRNLPNNSGSSALAPGANLAGVQSPALGGDRQAFDGPRPGGPGSDRGSLLSPSSASQSGSLPVSREGSSQGLPALPRHPSSDNGRPVDPGLPQNGFRSPPGWSLAPAQQQLPPPPPPPPPQAASMSITSPRSLLLRRKSSGTLSKISIQSQGGPPVPPHPPLPLAAGATAKAPLGAPPPAPPPPTPQSAASALTPMSPLTGRAMGSLPARHGKTPSFSATSSGFEPGAVTYVPNHNTLITGGRGRSPSVSTTGGGGGRGAAGGKVGSALGGGSVGPNEGFHAALLSGVTDAGVSEFGALPEESTSVLGGRTVDA